MLTKFQQKVYNLLKKIPKGQVTTYKILAEAIGRPRNWRQIGKILSQNPNLKDFPCFRVIKSNGRVGGYSRGIKQKITFLRKNGIIIKKDRIVNLESCLFKFNSKGKTQSAK
ncbi:MAG: MGMT family protein [Patescibacteria group bacterium]|nr:MGMT family protein [Patescibacteria group bacterium]